MQLTIRYFLKAILLLAISLPAGNVARLAVKWPAGQHCLLAQDGHTTAITDEKTTLFSDKASYLAGEIIWFTAFITVSPGNTGSKVAYVELLNNRGKTASQAKMLIHNGSGKGSFYLPLTLPSGVYTLVAYTAKNQLAGPGTFFKKRIEIINTLVNPLGAGDSSIGGNNAGTTVTVTNDGSNTGQVLKMETDKQIYSAREKIEINIYPAAGVNESQSIKGNLSVYYLPASEKNKKATTNIVNTHPVEQRRSDIIPEYDGHIVTARVISNWNQQPASGVNCVLSVPSATPFGFYTGTSNGDGIVRFNVNGYFGNGEVIIKAFPDKNASSYTFQIVSPFADSSYRPYFTGNIQLADSDSIELVRRSIAMQATNIYYQKKLTSFLPPLVTDTLPFFGKAEYTYYLDDYKRFSTMEEVLREYVRTINVNVRNGKLRISMFDEKNLRIYDDGILVMIDGVPVTEYNNIFKYDPLKVKRLQIVPRLFLTGQHAFSGVASFETYHSKFDAFDIDNLVSVFEYDGFQLQRDFFSPSEKERENLRMPDYRTTLLWAPDIKITGSGKYAAEAFTSDFPGIYKVLFEGVLANGDPVQVEKTIEVREK